VLTAACGSSGSHAAVSTPPGDGNGGERQVQVDEKANGTTVHAQLGAVMTVTLHSTYWNLLPPSDGFVVQPYAPAATAPATTCPVHAPGTGCGTVVATYNLGHVGTAVLRAHRDSCGEALRCVGAAADWKVTVVVS
jgi:hypothetical protein